MENLVVQDLNSKRNDALKSLGFLCYNLYIDGIVVYNDMTSVVGEIKSILMNSGLQLNEGFLHTKLIELGCICYNLYIDNKVKHDDLFSLCNKLAALNSEIIRLNAIAGNDGIAKNSENRNIQNGKPDGFVVSGSFGMERIPTDYRLCKCGYRNRPEARYCGKCGAVLI